METITLAQLIQAVDGTLAGEFANLETPISGVDTDSRAIHPGSLFIPLVGDRFDGHAYIESALSAGAVGCITAKDLSNPRPDRFYVRVEDTEKALGALASWYKTLFPIPFLAVTGSVGKTTTKDMLAAVLGVKYNVMKTAGNHNNNVGMPLTLLGLNRSHEIGILELGMDKFGEIDYLARLVQPDVGIITNIGDAHIERLGSRENIFKAKCELVPHVKENGLLVLNGDDEFLKTLRGTTRIPTVFYGKGEGLEYQAQVTGGDGASHIHCRMRTPHMDRDIKIPALVDHIVYPSLIAAVVGERFELTPDEIEEGISRFVPTRMRMNLLCRRDHITILDDTYNANPQSMRAAIQVLADSQGQNKVAVLGDMFELGPFAPALHTGVGECLGKAGINCLVAVGELAAQIAEGARSSGVPEIHYCRTKEEAKLVLERLVQPDSVFLVKASRGMKMEELSAYLTELTLEK